jgi:hypothetical protein
MIKIRIFQSAVLPMTSTTQRLRIQTKYKVSKQKMLVAFLFKRLSTQNTRLIVSSLPSQTKISNLIMALKTRIYSLLQCMTILRKTSNNLISKWATFLRQYKKTLMTTITNMKMENLMKVRMN